MFLEQVVRFRLGFPQGHTDTPPLPPGRSRPAAQYLFHPYEPFVLCCMQPSPGINTPQMVVNLHYPKEPCRQLALSMAIPNTRPMDQS
jgi:hypothetical protein